MAELFTMENLLALLLLTSLEIVLGIDNVVFISILSNRLPEHQRTLGQRLGIGLAVFSRIALLLAISWVQSLEAQHAFHLFGRALSVKDVILILGGLFLIGKSTYEIHEKLEAASRGIHESQLEPLNLYSMLAQVVMIDVVFSLDSVITAVGISNVLPVMITAIVIAAGVMMFFASWISDFIRRHPTMKMLALSFLILIGSMLVIEGWAPEKAHQLHLRNYAYFAMAFSLFVELINMRLRPSTAPVPIHIPGAEGKATKPDC
ncbi:MAG: TerC family protein [Chloroflexi bacterium]|nr:TerC family protein [Chloroflexota bacterium]